jgi:hypothetical protein
MAAVLHLVKSAHTELAVTAIERALADGNAVHVALLHGAPAPRVPPGARVVRVPDDLSYDALLDLIFASDHVVTW